MSRRYAARCFLLMIVCAAAINGSVATAQEPSPDLYLGLPLPGILPEVFAPGVIPPEGTVIHSAPVFAPDFSQVVFAVQYPPDYEHPVLLIMHRTESGWVGPEAVPFGSQYGDDMPFFARDGERLYFVSKRPVLPSSEPEDQFLPWFVARAGTGWSDPQFLGTPLEIDRDEGPLYFDSELPGGHGDLDIYRTEYEDGAYTVPTNLGPAINTASAEYSPTWSLDGDYVIFTRFNNQTRDLGIYISFLQDDGLWGEAQPMDAVIDPARSPRFTGLSPDGAFLFFTGKLDDISVLYWVDTSVIEQFRPD